MLGKESKQGCGWQSHSTKNSGVQIALESLTIQSKADLLYFHANQWLDMGLLFYV